MRQLILSISLFVLIALTNKVRAGYTSKLDHLFNKADSLYNKSKYAEAFIVYNEIQEYCHEKRDTPCLIKVRISIADLNRTTGNHEYGLKILKETLLKFNVDRKDEKKIFNKQSAIFHELNIIDSALYYVKLSCEEEMIAYHSTGESQDFLMLAAAYIPINFDSAKKYLDISEKHFILNQDFNLMALANFNFAKLFFHKKDYEKALHHLFLLENLAIELDIPIYQNMAYHILKEIYKDQKDVDKLLEVVYKESELLIKESNKKESFNKIQNVILKLKTDNKLISNKLNKQKLKFEQEQNAKKSIVIASGGAVMVLLIVLVLVLIKNSNAKSIQMRKLKVLNEELEKRSDRLKKLNDTKQNMLKIIGHDLRSPFAQLKSLMEISLLEELSQEQTNTLLKAINENVDSGISILDNLLSWTSANIDFDSATNEQNDIREIVDGVLNQLSKQMRDKNLRIINTVENRTYHFPKAVIEIVLRNLLSNAIKFTPCGESISLSSVNKSQYANLIIKDNGIGIQDDVLTALNLPHSQINTTKGTNGEKGAGLGIRLIKNLAKKCSSTIYFEKNEKGGTTVTFSFPINSKKG